MSEHEGESSETGITDDQLPEDLQPGEDNPLAEPLDPDDVDRDLEMDATHEPDESSESAESEESGSDD